MSLKDQVDILGVTCDSKLNIYTHPQLDKVTDDGNAKRIDYIFTSETLIEEAKVAFTERIPIHNINYSDHFGVSVTLQLPNLTNRKKVTGYISSEIFNSIREVTTAYVNREEKHSFLRICHSFFSLVVCLTMLIAVWFVEQKGYIFIMMLCGIISSWGGALNWVIGYVWGRWELRALREFMGEMDLARKVYAQEGLAVLEISSG